MARLSPARSASLLITLFGVLTNSSITFQIISSWRTLKWEPESEWEMSSDSWRVDGVKIIWALFSAYFISAAAVCAVGFLGVLRSKLSYVRFYRDYSIADFSFSMFFTALATFGAFRNSTRAGLCEELSHHPELLQGMLETGLNLENCERWLERAVLACVAVMFIIMLIRLHFLLAISHYYSHLSKYQHRLPHRESSPCHSSTTLHRIYLIPRPAQPIPGNVEYVYTAVPLNSLPIDVQASAQEAWVSESNPKWNRQSHSGWFSPFQYESWVSSPNDQQPQSQCAPLTTRPHRHHHHRHHRSASSDQTGLIRLSITSNEGLLPSYNNKQETS